MTKPTKKFPPDAFQPEQGYLEPIIFENSSVGIPLGLHYTISFPFAPFDLEGEEVSTELVLDLIDLPVRSWRELAGHAHDFPVYPAEGCIDGSVYLFHAHNPVNVTRLSFGSIKGLSIPVTIDLSIDFTVEGDEAYGVPVMQWEAELEITPLKAINRVQEECGNDPERLARHIQQLVDLAAHGAPVVEDGTILFPPREGAE